MLFTLNPTWHYKTEDNWMIPVNLVETHHIPSELIPAPETVLKPLSLRKSFAAGIPSGKLKTKGLSVFPMKINEPEIVLDFELIGMESDLSGFIDGIEWKLDQNYEPVPLKNEVFIDNDIVKGMVVIPPNDRKAIQGYMYIAAATGGSFAWQNTLENAAKNLASALNHFTNIKAFPEFRPMVSRRDETFHRNPVLFINTSRLFMLSTDELDYLKRYMYSDEFLIIDNDRTYQSPQRTRRIVTDRFRDMFSHASWRTGKLQPRHPVFHSYFDIESIPQGTMDESNEPTIWGLFLNQSLSMNALFLEPGYAALWKDDKKNRRQIELAINIVVYGLARYEEISDEFKRTRYVSDYAIREW